MQLILESEATADITLTMSTVEESVNINLKDTIESLKGDICNGNSNKENIECEKNKLASDVNNVVEGVQKEITNNVVELPSATQDINSELEINDKTLEVPPTASSVKLALEKNGAENEVSRNGNAHENSNGVSNADNMNGDGLNLAENIEVEEQESECKNSLVDDIVIQENEEISLSSQEDSCEKLEKREETAESIIEEDKNNSHDVEIKELNDVDTESKKDHAEPVETIDNSMDGVEVDEDISEIAQGVDKAISEMEMLVDEDVLEGADGDNSPKNAPLNEVSIESDCDIVELADATVDLIPESKDKNELVSELPVESEKSTTQSKVSDDVDGEQSKSVVPLTTEEKETSTVHIESEVKVTEEMPNNKQAQTTVLDPTLVTEQRDVEAKVLEDTEVQKIDDDVIQIESEQDCESIENITVETDNGVVDISEKVVENDVKEVSDEGKPMPEESSITEDKDTSTAQESEKIDEICNIVDDKVEVLDEDEIKVKESTENSSQSAKADEPNKAPVLKLSNTLDILSDDDEELQLQPKPQKIAAPTPSDKQCINIEDDDDVMLIDEETDVKENKTSPVQPMEVQTEERKEENTNECTIDLENGEPQDIKKVDEAVAVPEVEKDPVIATPEAKSPTKDLQTADTIKETKKEVKEPLKPLLPENFLKSCKKNLSDMTREELEEFCIMKIVESIMDRSNLGEIKNKLKLLTQNIDEHKKKALMLTKQNRDLQLVLKSVQEEQKKKPDSVITPLKITRSVGMQVLMTEKVGPRKKPNNNAAPLSLTNPTRGIRPPNQSPRAQKPAGNQQIPVPRLVPATANPVAKSPITQSNPSNIQAKPTIQFNGARMSPPVQKAEKRPHNRMQSVTVDLTDDEPPAKVPPRSSPAPPVRVVSSQNLLATPRSQATAINSPRKVYIPISGPQGQNIRPGQTIMLKSVPPPGPRQRAMVPNVTSRGPAPNVIKRLPNSRHPAPLPDAMKQYQPPNWKALPPAPDLKLSKVENGIVISWKIEGYQEDSYEEIASYQLYAYQETSSPPSTALWKKIGDVKALPLPMACTLTQFMAGFKYYFAVRAVDIRSRLGPFSLPGSILLLNKM